MFVFLDIGFTLVGGPNIGPAGRLIRDLGLPPSSKTALNELLFESPVSTPDSLSERLARHHGIDRQRTDRAVAELWAKQIEEAYVLPGAREAMERLKRSGVGVGFISNIWAPFLQAFARLFPIEFKEYPVYASFQRGVSKPDIELYRLALRETGWDPKRTVMIGDTYEMDIAPPKRLGLKTVWILHRPDKEREDLVKILNGSQPAPDLTLTGMEMLTVEALHGLSGFRDQPFQEKG